MLPNQNKKQRQSLTAKLTSLVWAISLISPALLLARTTSYGQPRFHLLLFIAGWSAWSYTEYFFHRFVMHDAVQERGLGKLLNHTHHHTDPDDIRIASHHRFLMIFCVIVLAFLSVLFNNYFTLVLGYFTGFTAYSFMHLVLHQRWSSTVFPGLHRFHIYHHCRHPDKCFGVITTWWDYLFGTVPTTDTRITEKVKRFYYRKYR